MGTCTVFDHTADLGLSITGDDLDDLFVAAASGLMAVVVANPGSIREALIETIDLRASRPDELLALWLNELIYRVETRHQVYARFDVKTSDGGLALTGSIAGETIDRDRHVLDHEVKAATRHELSLEQVEDGSWSARVIVDI
jgi:SHS2 domain-containing protein